MRDIKFRAWSINENLMYYDVGLVQKKDGPWWVFDNGARLCQSGDHYVIMQFTGAKDKNGREVYDGDIIRGPSNTNPYGGKSNRTKCFMFKIFWLQNDMFWGGWCMERLGNHNDPYRTFPRISGSEVVGNIYENPVLLEEKK